MRACSVNSRVDVTAVQETHFICAVDARVLEDDFVVLSALGGLCNTRISLLIRRSFNVYVNLFFAGNRGLAGYC